MSIERVYANEQPWHIEHIDVFAGCQRLKAASIHMICSSPPYWGLRDYGIPPRLWKDGQLCCYGLEPDVASYVRHTVELFEEFHRVLRDDGVIYWNVGDSYTSTPGQRKATDPCGDKQASSVASVAIGSRFDVDREAGSKLLVPHRVAIALADAGWIVRQDNVWAKKNPMAESVCGWSWQRCRVKIGASGIGKTKKGDPRGNANGHQAAKWKPCPGCRKCTPNGGYVLQRGAWRTTGAHEFVFQITKSEEYFCDGQAAREPVSGGAHSRGHGMNPKAAGLDKSSGVRSNGSYAAHHSGMTDTRNPRSVWSISSETYKGAHFAVFPSELARRCIVGSLSPGGCCPACGAQYAPRIAKERVPTRPGKVSKIPGPNSREYQDRDAKKNGEYKHDRAYQDGVAMGGNPTEFGNRDPGRHVSLIKLEGYSPSCTCNAGPAIPSLVLEPFTGSGTTIQVATHYGHRAIGFEINPDYIELAKDRVPKTPRCAKKKGVKSQPDPSPNQPLLF